MQVHAFILHLTRATARRENAQDLLDDCGLAGQIWPAVDGAAMSSSDLSSTVGAQLFDPAYPFALKTGEVGCFLSHRQIWAELQSHTADAALIIEDDAAIDASLFAHALRVASHNITDLDYIQFQTRPAARPSILIDTSGPCALVVPQQAGLRTTAQMVSRRAAAHLLRLSEAIDRPVDTFVQSHWHTGLRPAAIYPSGITDIADQMDGSTIQGGSSPSRLAKLRREVARLRYRAGVKRMSRHSPAPSAGGLDG